MRHSKPAQLETAPTKHGGESVSLFLEFTIIRHSKSAQLETAPTKDGGESVYLFLEFTIILP